MSDVWRTVFKSVAIYAAAAWASIEVVDFAVSKYGFSRLLLDVSVLVAFGGGMVTAVIAWFHGEAGPQKPRLPEIVTITAIMLATATAATYLVLRDPLAQFNELEGYRLTFEFREAGTTSG